MATLGRVARIGDGCMTRRLLGCAFTSKNRKRGSGRELSAATSATGEHLRGSAARWWPRSTPNANSERDWLAERWRMEGPCGLTFALSRGL